MIKRIVQYIKRRNDIRLRKWCVRLAEKTNTHYDCVYYTANQIYKWIKGFPES